MNHNESEKIGAVYKTERRRLLGYIRNRVSDDFDAEDILHDVFYQLAVGFNGILNVEHIIAWLYRVADNRITDQFRKKKPEAFGNIGPLKEDEDGPVSIWEILPALGTSPEDEEIKQMIWTVIEKTLADLPEEQSSVFVANEFDDMSFNEISEKTGVGINTLISRKRYAVLALRKELFDLYNALKNN